MKKFESLTMPLGMIGVIFYLLHTLLGQLLWPDYNPITTDISYSQKELSFTRCS